MLQCIMPFFPAPRDYTLAYLLRGGKGCENASDCVAACTPPCSPHRTPAKADEDRLHGISPVRRPHVRGAFAAPHGERL
jgi:hypothetical protein